RQDAIDVVDGVLAVERNFHMAAREEAVQGELALGCRVVAAEPADQPVGSNTQYAQRLVQRRSRWRPRASIWPRWARSAASAREDGQAVPRLRIGPRQGGLIGQFPCGEVLAGRAKAPSWRAGPRTRSRAGYQRDGTTHQVAEGER